LRKKHVPQSEAQSNAKLRLDDGKKDQADHEGDENKPGVVKQVVGQEQQKKPAKRTHHAAKDADQAKMLGAYMESVDSDGDEKRTENNHAQGEELLAQGPIPGASYQLFQGAHGCQPRGV